MPDTPHTPESILEEFKKGDSTHRGVNVPALARSLAFARSDRDRLAAIVQRVREVPRWRMTEPDAPCSDGPWVRAYDLTRALEADA